MIEVSGRKIVIMGGTSGMGLAAARQLASLGASLVVTGRDQDRAAKVRQENPDLVVEIVDATSAEGLDRFYRSQGSIGDLVLCVSGAKGGGPFAQLSNVELHEGFQQKFFAQFHAAQRALPFLQKDGSITFVSAISARAANPGTVGLAAINGAIESMVKPLARELKPLRINAVSPGCRRNTVVGQARAQRARDVAETIGCRLAGRTQRLAPGTRECYRVPGYKPICERYRIGD